jgi:hypothetical protein
MAEEVTKVVENIDKLFSEIVVNGESHVSDRYVPPEPAQSNPPVAQEEEETPQQTTPQRDVQGEYVDTLYLNHTLHDLKDSPLTQQVALIQQAINGLQQALNAITAKIPSTASSENQLADKNFVNSSVEADIAEAINDLDVPVEGGNGKYIKSISQVNGKIIAESDYLSSTGGGVAFVGTRAQYEVAKLIPLGQTEHIPSGALVIITDEDDYLNSEDR